jgi:phosphoribosylpyrophosphate synthetase
LDRRAEAGERGFGHRAHPVLQLGDKKDEPRVPIPARVCADAIEAAGADRVVTMDLHAPQVQGFFHIPVDDLYALPVLCDAIERKRLSNLVVVSPDAGFVTKARKLLGGCAFGGAAVADDIVTRTGQAFDYRRATGSSDT